MPIKVGDRLPAATLYELTEKGIQVLTVEQLTKGRRVALFAVPGAFTPTCSALHVPSFVAHHEALKAKGVDDVVCLSVNDPHVMDAWAKTQKSEGKIRMLSDGNAEFTRAIGLGVDMSSQGRSIRSQRYSLYAEDGVVKLLNVEQPGKFEVSDAQTLLAQIETLEVGRHG